jgi:hypothetical protein
MKQIYKFRTDSHFLVYKLIRKLTMSVTELGTRIQKSVRQSFCSQEVHSLIEKTEK